MYLEHFGLSRPPFKITPDTSLFFEGSQRGAALGALIFAIKNGEGIIKVVGEVGSGKTMLCRMLEVKLSDEVDIVYIANPSLSPDNILHVIAHELELEILPGASKFDVMQKIQAYLLKKHADNRQVVMFIEEAQSMPEETLEEIRLLSNLETDQNKLLQMVLFGQPELDKKLSQSHIRQLKERITHSFYLEPFLPKDTFDYLNFRMRAVGYRGPDIFNHKTAGSVKKYSNGLTRRINILADKSLMASFSEGKHQVAVKHVKIAAKDSDFENIGNNRKFIVGALMITSLILAMWVGTLLPGLKESMENNYGAITTDQSSRKVSSTSAQVKHSRIAAIGSTKMVDVNNDDKTSVDAKENRSKASSMFAESNMDSKVNTVIQSIETGNVNGTTSIDTSGSIDERGGFDSLLENRLFETENWFSTVEDNHYSIQLLLARQQGFDALEEFLGNVSESLDFNKIYIYETLINNKHMYSVTYGDFAAFSDATEALVVLSVDFQASGPFVRRVSALRKEFVMMHSDEMETNVTLNDPVNR